MFADNPFLSAAEQFTDEALRAYGLVRSSMNQSTRGETAFEVNCYLADPPSPYPQLNVAFTYDLGALEQVTWARELAAHGEGDPGEAERQCTLYLTTTMEFLLPAEEDAERVSSELEPLVLGRSLTGVGAEAWLQTQSRRSLRARLIGGAEAIPSLQIGFEELFTVPEVHARDWAVAARNSREFAAQICEVALGLEVPSPTAFMG